MVRGAWLLAAVVALTASGPAGATTVVLVRVSGAGGAPRWRAAEDRMRDELRALGMQVTEVQPPGADAMTTLLAEHAADAAVQVTRAGEHASVTVWLAGPDDARPRQVSLAVDGREHAGVAMLRAAELVRTEIRERAEPAPSAPPPIEPAVPASPDPTPPLIPAPPEPTPPTAEPPEPPEPPKSDHLNDSTAPVPESPFENNANNISIQNKRERRRPSPLFSKNAAQTSPARRHGLVINTTIGGGPGVLTGLELAGRRELTRRLDIGGGVTTLVSPTWRTDARGSVLLGLTAARLALTLRLPLGARTSLHLSGGGGLALGWAHGRANSPYRGSTDARVVGMMSTALAFVVRLAPHTSMHAGAALDLLLPSMQIRSGGADLVRLGLPLIRGTLGVAWDWQLRAKRPN